MDPRTFAPVTVFFGKPGQTQIVTSARKSGELLTMAGAGHQDTAEGSRGHPRAADRQRDAYRGARGLRCGWSK